MPHATIEHANRVSVNVFILAPVSWMVTVDNARFAGSPPEPARAPRGDGYLYTGPLRSTMVFDAIGHSRSCADLCAMTALYQCALISKASPQLRVTTNRFATGALQLHRQDQRYIERLLCQI
jgi:hypothetical protein